MTGCSSTPTVSTTNDISYAVSLAACPTASTVTIKLNAGSVADLAGNVGPAAASNTISLTTDYVAPTVVSFATAHYSTTNSNPLVYTLTFSEAVSGLTAADFSITGCASTPIITTSNNITYTISLSGCARLPLLVQPSTQHLLSTQQATLARQPFQTPSRC